MTPPSIHVWTTIDEAAQTLGISPGLVSCQLELGELESRVNADGAQEVLIALPPRTDDSIFPEKVGVAIVADALSTTQPQDGPSSTATLATALVPMLQSIRRAQAREVRKARRGARLAWSVAAGMLLAVGVATADGVHALTAARDQVQHLSETLDQTHAATGEIDVDRQALRAQLAEARQAAARAEGELAVERKVEDTLFKNALAQHASEKSEKNPLTAPVVASGAD
jgi:hypothetical protein